MLKENINLVPIVEAAGVNLKRNGNRYIGLCPFHDEKTPSFFVFRDNRYKCFGCGEHGDVISFVKKLYGLSFVDALKHLGINNDKPVVMKIEIKDHQLRAGLVKDFRNWEIVYCIFVSDLKFRTERLMTHGIQPNDLDFYTPLINAMSTWEYHIDILINGDDRAKFKLCNEVHGCIQNALIWAKSYKKRE